MILRMLRGLPASGKTTYAKALEAEGWVRVNKDDIRIQLGMSRSAYKREQEAAVIDRRDDAICKALEAGKSVVSDDTNFGKKHEPRLRELAKRYGAAFEVADFTHVPVEVCIARDAERPEDQRVGPDVIWGMAEAHLGLKKPETPDIGVYVNDPTLPSAVICDLDGTLALFNGLRGPYEYHKCAKDRLNVPIRDLIRRYDYLGFTIIYLSGREDSAREQTEEFLRVNHCPKGPLFMRATVDHRKDSIVKRELFDAHVRGKYRVEFCLDDRDQVVKLWRDMGLTCLQVAYGNF